MDGIVIVDQRPQDYAELIAAAAVSGLECCVFASAEAALRGGHRVGRFLWLVNMRLPDGLGAEFLAEIKALRDEDSVWLVADRYSPGDEVAARMAAASAFLCKPTGRFAELLGLRGAEEYAETAVDLSLIC